MENKSINFVELHIQMSELNPTNHLGGCSFADVYRF